LLKKIKVIERRGSRSQKVPRKIELHTCFDESEAKRQLGRPKCSWQDLKLIFKKQDGRKWTGLIWLRRTSGGVF
jgi:hypothetical protein